jgi:hypothetical protein
MDAVVETVTDRIQQLVRIVEAEFEEMPGMRLTREQARRLWNLSIDECDVVLGRLKKCGRLVRDRAGQYHVPGNDY